MNKFMQLDEVGIVSSPEGILEAIIQRFRMTDAYQSKIFPVASLKGIIALTAGNKTNTINMARTALERVLDAYFPEGYQLEVDIVDKGTESELTIAIDVVTDEGSLSASWALQVIEGKTDLKRKITGEESSYDV